MDMLMHMDMCMSMCICMHMHMHMHMDMYISHSCIVDVVAAVAAAAQEEVGGGGGGGGGGSDGGWRMVGGGVGGGADGGSDGGGEGGGDGEGCSSGGGGGEGGGGGGGGGAAFPAMKNMDSMTREPTKQTPMMAYNRGAGGELAKHRLGRHRTRSGMTHLPRRARCNAGQLLRRSCTAGAACCPHGRRCK